MNRAEAARINGAKSNGPTTEEGKAVSSKNALHFGLNARDVVIPGENPAEYEQLFAQLQATYGPANMLEYDLLSEIAATRWRLRRVARMEKAAFNAAYQRASTASDAASLTEEQLETRVMNEFTNSSELRQIHRHETRLRRQWEKARADLEALIGQRQMADLLAQQEQARVEAEAKAAKFRADYLAATTPPSLRSASGTGSARRVQNEPEKAPDDARAAA